jgi:hypothetical protein
MVTLPGGRILLAVLFPLVAIAVGVGVYLDARGRGRGELAPWIGLVVGGLFVSGSVPGLVALAVSGDAAAVQGFPTALRIVPGLVALAVYLYFR